MSLRSLLFGKPIPDEEASEEKLGVLDGVPVSAAPSLRPHLLAICLALLALLLVVNLRGLRTAGVAFMLPTWSFVLLLGGVLAVGGARALAAGGAPQPAVPPHPLPPATVAVGVWLALHAFASGCTAMTGVEAVSNAVPVFREPTRRRAQRTLAVTVTILCLLLLGISWLVRAYERRWYHYLLHSHTATALKLQLLFRGGPQVVVVDAPWYLRERPARAEHAARASRRSRRPPALA